MNRTSRDPFLARPALRAWRPRPSLGLAAVLAVLVASIGNSCSSDADYQACRAQEQQGQFLFEKDDLCGCERLQCQHGTQCFHGDCCDPQLYSDDHDRCGCKVACKESEVCHAGECCDPTSPDARSRTNCGCAGPCGDRQDCQVGADGRYQCVCDPKLSLTDRENCGCTGMACDPDTERCRNGACECDPLAGPTQQDDANCACRGECPFEMQGGTKVRTAYCYGGVCHCFSADEVVCDGECKKEADCVCDPAKHQSDASNCSCNGPCAPGDMCQNGTCTCDPLAHASDDQRCGCSPTPCDTAHAYHCEQGTCACPAAMYSNNLNCGCSGKACDTAHGYQCEQGTCACPAAMLGNNVNCGCSGKACDLANGFACAGGVCACSAAHQSDPKSCGCPGVVCDPGAVCVDGKCGQCVMVADMTVFPKAVPGSGDTDFNGHGPVVTVSVHLSYDAGAHTLTIKACVDMVETEWDWTHGNDCQTQVLHVPGSALASAPDFMLKYTDTSHAPDDAMAKASSLLQNPVVLGVTCLGDTDGDDIAPACIGQFCSSCTLQFGCVAIAP